MSTYFTAKLIALPEKVAEPELNENGWVCEPPPPVDPVDPGLFAMPDKEGIPGATVPGALNPNVWVWLGICGVVSVVAPALPEIVLIDTEPVGVCDTKAVVKSTEPPVDAVPVTTRNALLLPVDVFFVQPVGALVCANNMTVPEGNPPAAAWNVGRAPAPFDVNTCPDVPTEAIDC